jgi:diaminopimelate dehydrogenase
MEKLSSDNGDAGYLEKIKIGIVGYGNIGRGVEKAVGRNQDCTLEGIITRRPEAVKEEVSGIKVIGFEEYLDIDVAILCGGSAKDLPEQGPEFASKYNTVDSFDNHGKIPEYFAKMDEIAKESGNVAVISAGWDPGTFSMERVLADAFLPGANPSGFYGLSETGGLSMGHSDALRKVEGVKDARQYTHAVPEAIESAKRGEKVETGDMHWRECIVVVEDGADKERIEEDIKTMPNYFAPYKTTVRFVTQQELEEIHSGMPHDGIVIATTLIGNDIRGTIEYRNQWDSNPNGTASILVAHARAAARLKREGKSGAFTILDIPPAYFSLRDREELHKKFM